MTKAIKETRLMLRQVYYDVHSTATEVLGRLREHEDMDAFLLGPRQEGFDELYVDGQLVGYLFSNRKPPMLVLGPATLEELPPPTQGWPGGRPALRTVRALLLDTQVRPNWIRGSHLIEQYRSGGDFDTDPFFEERLQQAIAHKRERLFMMYTQPMWVHARQLGGIPLRELTSPRYRPRTLSLPRDPFPKRAIEYRAWRDRLQFLFERLPDDHLDD